MRKIIISYQQTYYLIDVLKYLLDILIGIVSLRVAIYGCPNIQEDIAQVSHIRDVMRQIESLGGVVDHHAVDLIYK